MTSEMVGKVVSFRYPVQNRDDVPLIWVPRKAVIKAARDIQERPLDAITPQTDPHVLRGRILLAAFDLEKQAARQFYFESMREIEILDEAGAEQVVQGHTPCSSDFSANCLRNVRNSLPCEKAAGPTHLRAPRKDRTTGRMPRKGGSFMAIHGKSVERFTKPPRPRITSGPIYRLAMFDICEPGDSNEFFGPLFTNTPEDYRIARMMIRKCNRIARRRNLPFNVGLFPVEQ